MFLRSGIVSFRRVCISREIHSSPRNHYDVLGLTPKASQGDIKKAYYVLSMQFHPDKQGGNDEKFRELTAAYEILSNLRLRRLYDRGMLPAGVTNVVDVEDYTHETTDTSHFTRTDIKSKVPTTGRVKGVYNFDEWSKAHYSNLMTRQQEAKEKSVEQGVKRQEDKVKRESEHLIWVIGLVLLIGVFISPDNNPDHNRWSIDRVAVETAPKMSKDSGNTKR